MGSEIEIKNIEIFPVIPRAGLLAFVSFKLNDSFMCHGISIHSRPDGSIRLQFPDKILKNGRRINLFYPISKEAESIVLSTISEKYYQLINK